MHLQHILMGGKLFKTSEVARVSRVGELPAHPGNQNEDKYEEKLLKIKIIDRNLRKYENIELLPIRDCEAGYAAPRHCLKLLFLFTKSRYIL